MNKNYFRYRVKDRWITLKHENDKYYILEPNSFELFELNNVQGHVIIQMKVFNKDPHEIINDFGLDDKVGNNFLLLLEDWKGKGLI